MPRMQVAQTPISFVIKKVRCSLAGIHDFRVLGA